MTTSSIKFNEKQILFFYILFILGMSATLAQEEQDYIEFNDRKNIVHGVYFGVAGYYGHINNEDTYQTVMKLAYVADRKLEIGFTAVAFFSDQNVPSLSPDGKDGLLGGYGGLHLEPIFFGKQKLNLSFPVLIGTGVVSYVENYEEYDDEAEGADLEDWDVAFVVEPGVSVLCNISRYVQLEAGIKYRWSSKIVMTPKTVDNLNGFSVGIGAKFGVFNLGRNRYKKTLKNEK